MGEPNCLDCIHEPVSWFQQPCYGCDQKKCYKPKQEPNPEPTKGEEVGQSMIDSIMDRLGKIDRLLESVVGLDPMLKKKDTEDRLDRIEAWAKKYDDYDEPRDTESTTETPPPAHTTEPLSVCEEEEAIRFFHVGDPNGCAMHTPSAESDRIAHCTVTPPPEPHESPAVGGEAGRELHLFGFRVYPTDDMDPDALVCGRGVERHLDMIQNDKWLSMGYELARENKKLREDVSQFESRLSEEHYWKGRYNESYEKFTHREHVEKERDDLKGELKSANNCVEISKHMHEAAIKVCNARKETIDIIKVQRDEARKHLTAINDAIKELRKDPMSQVAMFGGMFCDWSKLTEALKAAESFMDSDDGESEG